MTTAQQLRAGMAIRHDGQPYKVLAADYHPGQGKMGGTNHVRLRNLETGTNWETSLRAELKLEELQVSRETLEFLYTDDDALVFMNPENYEQVEMPASLVGEQARFLETGTRLPVEFIEGKPVSVTFPDLLDVRIDDTAPPVHGQADSAWKPARLENGAEVMVPPFVKPGDAIRLNLGEMRYVDRVKARSAGHS